MNNIKEIIKTILILAFIYLLFIVYVIVASNRIQNLDEDSYTKEGHNRSIVLVK